MTGSKHPRALDVVEICVQLLQPSVDPPLGTRVIPPGERWYVPSDPARPRSPALFGLHRTPQAPRCDVVTAFTVRSACEVFLRRWCPDAVVLERRNPRQFAEWVQGQGYVVVVDLQVEDDGQAPSYWVPVWNANKGSPAPRATGGREPHRHGRGSR